MTLQTCANSRIFCIAFGGNVETSLGSPQQTMTAALGQLDNDHIRITARSRFYDTPAFPAGSGPNFVNGAVMVETDLTCDALLATLHDLEARFGRQRLTRWGARTLDLDILFCGNEIRPDPAVWGYWHGLSAEKQQQEAPDQLVLPHPRLQDRAFVLVPLCDIAPMWQHPVLGCTARQLLAKLPENLIDQVKPL